MSNLLRLTDAQIDRLRRFFPKSHGRPKVDDRRVLSGIILTAAVTRYKRRNRIEIMFGRLKDWRRIATRYDRCPVVFFSAIALAATVLFWL